MVVVLAKNLVSFFSFFLLISFPLLFPFFWTRNAQPRCRAASHPIFTGYGKLILSNAILRRGYLPIPMDTAQVSPFPFPWRTFDSSPDRKSYLSLSHPFSLSTSTSSFYHYDKIFINLSSSLFFCAIQSDDLKLFFIDATLSRTECAWVSIGLHPIVDTEYSVRNMNSSNLLWL